MNSQKLNDWLQIAGMFGIIGTLIFVGVQMMQTQKIALSANYQARAATSAEVEMAASGNPLILSGFAKLYRGSANQLTAEEVVALEFLLGTYMKLFENNHYQYQMGFLSEEHWEGSFKEMKCQYELPFFTSLLQSWQFRESFSNVMEQAKKEAINNPSGCWTYVSDHPINN
jgi:hypothetical protein